MTRIIIELDLPEDKTDFLIIPHAMDFALTCYDIDNQLRDWLKYGYIFNSVEDCLESTRERLREIMQDRNISLEMIE